MDRVRRSDIAVLVIGIGVEVIVTILGIVMDTLPDLLTVIGLFVGGLMIMWGILALMDLEMLWPLRWPLRRRRKDDSEGMRRPTSGFRRRNVAVPPIQQDVGTDLLDWIRSEIHDVHFGWLWKDDPYLLFIVHISNASPYDIEITGVEGSANINDTSCTRDAKVPTGFGTKVVPKLTPQYQISFYQPLAEAHARKLQTRLREGGPIPFDLSPVGWAGGVALPNGKVPFPRRLSCATQFEVDGARISPDHSQASVLPIRLAGTGPKIG